MARGDYRYEVIQDRQGNDCAVPSAQWKSELMTPDLHRVKGPLSRTVWRYMKFEHLEAALRKQILYFPRADQLGDPWEGSLSDTEDIRANELFRDRDDDAIGKLTQSIQSHNRQSVQRLNFVSCWHMNDFESELLWQRYAGKHTEAVAVSTSIGVLCTLRPTPVTVGDIEFTPRFCAGEVEYVDHSVSGSVPRDELSLYYKKNEFSGDQEFRAIVQLWAMGFSQHDNSGLPVGVEVKIAPVSTFDRIVTKPENLALADKVNRLLDELGYDIPVSSSALAAHPKWG